MSVNLAMLRVEVVDDHPKLKDFEYSCTKDKKPSTEYPRFVNAINSDKNIKASRGLREPRKITIVSLDSKAIAEEMKAFDLSRIKCFDNVHSLKEHQAQRQDNANAVKKMVETLDKNSQIQFKTHAESENSLKNDPVVENRLTASDQPEDVEAEDFKSNNSETSGTEFSGDNVQEISGDDAKEKVSGSEVLSKKEMKYKKKALAKARAAAEKDKGPSNKVKANAKKKTVKEQPKEPTLKQNTQVHKEPTVEGKSENVAMMDKVDQIPPQKISPKLKVKTTALLETPHENLIVEGNLNDDVILNTNSILEKDTSDSQCGSNLRQYTNKNVAKKLKSPHKKESFCDEKKNTNAVHPKTEVSVKEKKAKKKFISESAVNIDDNSVSGNSYGLKESSPKPSSSKEGTPVSIMESHDFESGNSLVEITRGILHFYKENSKTSLEETGERSNMLCMLAVPTSMGIHDIFQFTAACYTYIVHLRIIRDSNPNQYLVLFSFKSQDETDFFYKTYNGSRFNNIQTDVCKLVYVSRVETSDESKGSLPIPGYTELPTCPVCLERMDESVDGILTILCNHSFHGECLAKWGDTSCPVCRYCQVPDEIPEQRCVSCGATSSLWICLICGHVGCGRYLGEHAHTHFTETSHLFALEVGSNRVWDYVRDNYVHRLLQSEGDGKVVSYERENDNAECKELNAHGGEKLSAIQLEYTHLLTIQMDSQREYFERKLKEITLEADKEMDATRQEENILKEELKNSKESLTKILREKKSAETKLQTITDKLSKVMKDLSEEKTIAKSVLQNNIRLAKEIKILEDDHQKDSLKILELRQQAEDIMRHLSAADAIEKNPEIEGGSVSLPPTTPKNRRGRGRRR